MMFSTEAQYAVKTFNETSHDTQNKLATFAEKNQLPNS